MDMPIHTSISVELPLCSEGHAENHDDIPLAQLG
jgi:hypothetical protein